MKERQQFVSFGQQLTAANQKEFFDNLEKDQTKIMQRGGLVNDNKENVPINDTKVSSSIDTSSSQMLTPTVDSQNSRSNIQLMDSSSSLMTLLQPQQIDLVKLL